MYRTLPEGRKAYHYKYTTWALVYPDCPDTILKKIVLSDPKKVVKRKMKGKEVNVLFYVYAFNGGYIFYYKNDTPLIYSEKLGIDLFNMVTFDGREESSFNFILDPNEEYMLKFKTKDPCMPYSYDSRVRYKLYAPPNKKEDPHFQVMINEMLAKAPNATDNPTTI
mmetsp:Transcript_10107/g.8624  ORF Transcript_10107/g.8624 Transcript_10107/m.8624 type:complete len:166 (+) Transcript_10107:2830-3327(+)